MLIATFSLPAAAIALKQTLADHPGVEIEAERIAAHSTEWTMPCLWVQSDDPDAVDASLRSDPTVDRVMETDEFGREVYYHLEWTDEVITRINTYVDREGSVLDAQANRDGWKMTFRFVSREQFDHFRDTLSENGQAFELLELYEPWAPRVSAAGVTPAQRNALVTARVRGYFDVPRQISARELAAELDISHQSLSELLRRGTGELVDSSLQITEENE